MTVPDVQESRLEHMVYRGFKAYVAFKVISSLVALIAVVGFFVVAFRYLHTDAAAFYLAGLFAVGVATLVIVALWVLVAWLRDHFV